MLVFGRRFVRVTANVDVVNSTAWVRTKALGKSQPYNIIIKNELEHIVFFRPTSTMDVFGTKSTYGHARRCRNWSSKNFSSSDRTSRPVRCATKHTTPEGPGHYADGKPERNYRRGVSKASHGQVAPTFATKAAVNALYSFLACDFSRFSRSLLAHTKALGLSFQYRRSTSL